MKTKFLATIVVVAMLFTMAAMPLNSLIASAEGATDTPNYDWNIANFDFSQMTKLPTDLVSTNQPHSISCEQKHADKDHMFLDENGELGWCSYEGWKMGGVNYVLDEPINSGKLVISTKYQAYTGTDRFAFNMNIHAVAPPSVSYGNGTPGASHLFALSVDASGNLVVTGKRPYGESVTKVVTFPAGISTDTTNRQEILIVIDFDTEEVKITTNEKTFETDFTKLGHDNANLKKVWGVGFGFGYVKDTGAGADTVGHVSYLKISDGALDAGDGGDGDGSDEVVYDWNVGNLDFSDKRILGDFRIFPSHAGFTCADKKHDISVHLKLRAGELGLTPYQIGQTAGFTYALNGTIESGKAVISTAFQTGLNMYLHSKDVENLGYGGGMATRFFQLGMGDTSITLYGENGKIVTFSDISIKKNAAGRQELLIIIDFDNDTISIDHGGDAPLTANFSELDIIAANEKLGCIGYGFNSNPSSWNEYRYVSSLKVSDGTLYTGGGEGDGDGDGSGSDDDVTSATYSWNLGNLNFRNYTSVSKLPANLIESHQEHGANSCDKQHSSSNHLILKNGQLGFSPLQTGKIGGVNYYLDEAISSGKVVISTKYQAYTGTGGSAFNMHIHAVDPATLAHGNGTVGSRVFAVSVDSSGKLVLTGKNGAVVSFDAGISTSTLNRQEMIIVIDFDTEEVAIRTGGKVYNTTLEELGHDNANLKKVCAVGFGFGYVRNQGVSPWDLRGYINYLKISDGTLGTGEDDIESPENGDNAIYFGIATVAVVATFAAFARKKKRI